MMVRQSIVMGMHHSHSVTVDFLIHADERGSKSVALHNRQAQLAWSKRFYPWQKSAIILKAIARSLMLVSYHTN